MNRIYSLFFFILLSYSVNAQEIKKQAVPATIVSVIESKSGGIPISMWVFDKQHNKYVATAMRDQTLLLIEVSAQAMWMSITQAFAEGSYPQVVMKAIKELYLDKGYEASNLMLIEKPTGTQYTVELTSEDEGYSVTLDQNGKIISREEL